MDPPLDGSIYTCGQSDTWRSHPRPSDWEMAHSSPISTAHALSQCNVKTISTCFYVDVASSGPERLGLAQIQEDRLSLQPQIERQVFKYYHPVNDQPVRRQTAWQLFLSQKKKTLCEHCLWSDIFAVARSYTLTTRRLLMKCNPSTRPAEQTFGG